MSTRYKASRTELAAVKQVARDALDALGDSGTTLAELIRSRDRGCCAICGRRTKAKLCAREDCHREYERLFQADKRERKRALKGGAMTAAAQLDMLPEVRLRPEDDENSRYTPRALILQLHREFGFTVDVASAAETPAAQIIGRFWTKADDGLKQSWAGERVWCNPPFDDLETWIKKAWFELAAPLVVMLIPANRTEQPFWHKWIEPQRDNGGPLTTRFIAARIEFGFPGNPEGVGVGSPQFGCVLLIWKRSVVKGPTTVPEGA